MVVAVVDDVLFGGHVDTAPHLGQIFHKTILGCE